MKNDRDRDLPPGLEEEWREWAAIDPTLDEIQLKRTLLEKIPDRRKRPAPRLVLVAAAASLVIVLIGIETIRHPAISVSPDEWSAAHEIDEGVVLILREGKEPIYVLTGSTRNDEGVRQ